MRTLKQSIHPGSTDSINKQNQIDNTIEELKVEINHLKEDLSEVSTKLDSKDESIQTDNVEVTYTVEANQVNATHLDGAYINASFKMKSKDLEVSNNLDAKDIVTETIDSNSGTIDNLTSNSIETNSLKTDSLEVTNFEVTEWTGDSATILDLNTDTLNVNDNFVAENANIQSLSTSSSFSNDLSAVNAEIVNLGATETTVKKLKVLEEASIENLENASISHFKHYVDLPNPVSDTNFNVIELPKILTGNYRVTFKDKETGDIYFSFTLNDTLENIYFSYSRGDDPKDLDQICIYQGKMYLQTWKGGRLYWHSDSLENQLPPESYSDWPFDLTTVQLDYPIFTATRKAATVYTNYVNLNIEDKPIGEAILDYFYTDDYSEVEEYIKDQKEWQYDPNTDLTLKSYMPNQDVNKEADVEFNSVKVKEDTVTERLTVNNGQPKQILRKREEQDNLVYEFPLEKLSKGQLKLGSDALLTESAVAYWDGSTDKEETEVEKTITGLDAPEISVQANYLKFEEVTIQSFKDWLAEVGILYEPNPGTGYYDTDSPFVMNGTYLNSFFLNDSGDLVFTNGTKYDWPDLDTIVYTKTDWERAVTFDLPYSEESELLNFFGSDVYEDGDFYKLRNPATYYYGTSGISDMMGWRKDTTNVLTPGGRVLIYSLVSSESKSLKKFSGSVSTLHLHQFEDRYYLSDVELAPDFNALYEVSRTLADTDSTGSKYYGAYKNQDNLLDNSHILDITKVEFEGIEDGVATYKELTSSDFSSNISFVNRVIEGEWAAGDVYIPNNKLTAKEAEIGELSIDNLEVTGDAHIAGDLTVDGEVVAVRTQEALVKDNTLTLRADATVAIQPGEASGLIINNYDGNGNSLELGVDSSGTMRVGTDIGTSGGNSEPLLTRSEEADLHNGHILVWDAEEVKAVDSGLTTDDIQKSLYIVGWEEFMKAMNITTKPGNLATTLQLIQDYYDENNLDSLEVVLPSRVSDEMAACGASLTGVFREFLSGTPVGNLITYEYRHDYDIEKFHLIYSNGNPGWESDNKFMNGILIQGSTDVSVENSQVTRPGVLVIGEPTGQHLAIDNNEILPKLGPSTVGTLYVPQGTFKVESDMVIPTKAPSNLQNGSIWIS